MEPLDAKKPLAREDFLKAYHAKAKEFDEEKDLEVPFCKNIHINNLDEVVECCPRGVVLERSTSDRSLWDALIRKVPNRGHEVVTTEIGSQLRNYAIAMKSKFEPALQAGGGHREVDEFELDGDVLPDRRIDPDQALGVMVPDDDQARVVIEIELSNRDPLPLAQHVYRLMATWPRLRCVVGLKIYKRSKKGGAFACVCFVWKKRSDNNNIYVERVFDIGPRKSSMRSCQAVAEFWSSKNVDFQGIATDDGNSFKVTQLPSDLDDPLPEECPDELEDHFTILIDKADVYHGHTPSKRSRRKKPKKIEDLKDDAPLEIDLFGMLVELDRVKSKNFK